MKVWRPQLCPFLKDTKQFLDPESHISNLMITGLFYSLEVVCIQEVSGLFTSLLLDSDLLIMAFWTSWEKGLWPQLFKTRINRYPVGRGSAEKNANWHWFVRHVISFSFANSTVFFCCATTNWTPGKGYHSKYMCIELQKHVFGTNGS